MVNDNGLIGMVFATILVLILLVFLYYTINRYIKHDASKKKHSS